MPNIERKKHNKKKKRDASSPYADCKPPEKLRKGVLENFIEECGLKKGKNRKEDVGILFNYMLHHSKHNNEDTTVVCQLE